jgi:hypothetical protein
MSKTSGSRSAPNPGWFPKGSSGNLKGRPRTARASQPSALEVLVDKTLTVNGAGGTREISVKEALQQRTYQDALAGKRSAVREVVKWIIKREAWLAKHAPKPSPTVVTQHIAEDPDNADAALLLLGIAAHDPRRADFAANRAQLLLEPWAVQAALRRRRGSNRLTDKERDEIRRCTRDPDSLRWPRRTGA